MNKQELIDAIAKESKLSKASSKKGERVGLVGFGSFYVVKRNARTGRNPQTGAKMTIKAKKVVKFRAGSKLI